MAITIGTKRFMMHLTPLALGVAAVMLTGLLSPMASNVRAADDQPVDEFARRYGEAFGKALATPSNTDDLALAKKLLADAPNYRKREAMLILMVRRAYDLASNEPSDFDLAEQALGLLMKYVPAKRLEWGIQQVGLRQRRHLRSRGKDRVKAQHQLLESYETTADLLEVQGEFYKALVYYRRALNLADSKDGSTARRLTGKIQTQPFRQRTKRKLEQLLAQLEINPQDRASARAIVQVYIVELYDPKSAKAYAPLFTGRRKRNVELADASSSKLSNDDAWELAMWYQTYADTALPMYRPPLLARARDLFKRFLRSPSKGDPRIAMAYSKLKQVDQRIRDLPNDLPTPQVYALGSRYSSSDSKYKKSWQDKRDKERERQRERDEPAANAITIEAERADRIIYPFQMKRDSDASGGSFGLVAHRTESQDKQMSTPSKGRIVFYVNMPQSTTVEISGRVRALPNSINSFFVSVAPGRDSEAKMRSWVFSTSPNKWQWTRYGKFKLAAGINTIVVAGREAGAGLDAIRITPRD